MTETRDGRLSGWPCSIDIYPAGPGRFELEVFLYTDEQDNEAPQDIRERHDRLERQYPSRAKMEAALEAEGFVPDAQEPPKIQVVKTELVTERAEPQVEAEAEEPKLVPYATVNGAWPEGKLPPLTKPEAISAAKKLWRMAMKKPCPYPIKIVSGNRYTYVRHGTLRVNAERGWKAMVHGISHSCHRRLHPGKKPHDFRHALLEREMIQYVISQGWLNGKLRRPEKAKPTRIDKRQAKLAATARKLKAWKTKAKRAKTAIAKLERELRYHEREISKLQA